MQKLLKKEDDKQMQIIKDCIFEEMFLLFCLFAVCPFIFIEL